MKFLMVWILKPLLITVKLFQALLDHHSFVLISHINV